MSLRTTSKFQNGKTIKNYNLSSIITTIISPITLFLVPTLQRINYLISMMILKDYELYKKFHEILSPFILRPMSLIGSIAYTPVIYFDSNTTEEEFKNDIQNDTQIIIGNHVGYSDFILSVQIACYYGVETNFVAYFMEKINRYLFIGPTFWGQIPLVRDQSGKDENTLHKRLTLYANSERKHLFALFPEGGLRRNPKLYDRTVKKNEQYGLNLQYMHFPKVKGFTKLVEIVSNSNKIKNLYCFIFLYDDKNIKKIGNKVNIIIKKICSIDAIPKEPSTEFVEKFNLTIDDENRLHYAHEEFILKWMVETDNILKEYYQSYADEDKPNIVNLYNKYPPLELEYNN